MMARGEEEAPPIVANTTAEGALLGTLLEKNSLVDIIADIIGPDDFYVPAHRRIYETILAKTAQGDPANPATLRPFFVDDEGLNQLGGIPYLLRLTEGGGIGIIGAKGFAEQIADIAARRRLVEALGDCKEAALDPEKPLAETVDASDAALVAAISKREGTNNVTLFDAMGEAIDRISAIKENDGKVGITTGIHEFDRLTGGFEAGQSIIIAARPGMGKTGFACSAALGISRHGDGVLFASLEMNSGELGTRMLSDICFDGQRGIPFSTLIEARTNAEEDKRLAAARDAISKWPLNIIDTGSLTLSRLNLGIRRQKRRFAAMGSELKVVFLDYLQLLHPDQPTKSPYEAVSLVSRGLKSIAKDNGIAVVALAQLNRAVEQREDKRPQLSDLRDSGQIEQDADAVIFLYREAYYLEKMGEPRSEEMRADYHQQLNSLRHRMDFILAKRRNGRCGQAHAIYNTEHQAVRSLGLEI